MNEFLPDPRARMGPAAGRLSARRRIEAMLTAFRPAQRDPVDLWTKIMRAIRVEALAAFPGPSLPHRTQESV